MSLFGRLAPYMSLAGDADTPVDGGYTFSPSAGLVPTQQVQPAQNKQNLADYLDTYSNLNTVDWGSIGPALQKLGIGQNGRDGSAGWIFNNNINQGDIGWSLSPESRAKLAGWTVGDPRLQGDTRTQQIVDNTGANVGTSSEDLSQSLLWDTILPGAIAAGMGYFAAPALGAALGGGLLGGAAGGAITGGAIAGATGNNVGQGALTGGLLGGVNGAMGNVPSSDVSSVSSGAQQAVDAYAQTPIDMAGLTQGIPDLGGAQTFPVAQPGMPSWVDSFPAEIQQAVEQAAQQTPQQVAQLAPQVSAPSWVDSVPAEIQQSLQQASVQTPQQVQALIPEWSVPSAPSWLDSVKSETEASLQQAAQQAPAQVNATMPDVSAIPQTLPTTGLSDFRKSELDGYQTNGSLPSSPAVPTGTGGLLGTLKGAGGTALDWMKANPGLAKLMLGGATALLSSQGGSSGGAAKSYGPAVKWKSPVAGIPQGLLGGGGGQQAQAQGYPAALGLLGGQPNSGAWRFLR